MRQYEDDAQEVTIALSIASGRSSEASARTSMIDRAVSQPAQFPHVVSVEPRSHDYCSPCFFRSADADYGFRNTSFPANGLSDTDGIRYDLKPTRAALGPILRRPQS